MQKSGCTLSAHRLHICPNRGLFCARFAQPAFLCIKMELVGTWSLHLLSQTVLSLKHPTGVFVAFANAKALSEQGSHQLSAFICIHQPDGFKDLPAGDFCCRRLFILPGLRCCRGQVLGIEVRFDLLGQLQPGLVLRVGMQKACAASFCRSRNSSCRSYSCAAAAVPMRRSQRPVRMRRC